MPGPKSEWITTEALVYEVNWIQGGDASPGYYTVTYSYSVAGDRYSGTIHHYGHADDVYLHRDDTIQIQYDPNHPQRSTYPSARETAQFLPKWALTCLRVLTIVLVLLILCFAWRK